MPVHRCTLLVSKIIVALKGALPRFLWGMVGTWCVLGPFVLLLRSESASWILTAVLVLSLLLCYASVLIIYFRLRWSTLRELISETACAMCFIIVGELANEIMGGFDTIKAEMALVYAYMGFFIAELMGPKASIKALGERLSMLLRKWSPYSQ